MLKPYRAGRDLTTRPRDTYVIDFAYMEETEARAFPLVFDIVRDRVKPERDANRREVLRKFWWRFGWPRREMRDALRGLARYIVTTETTKYRVFHFLDAEVAADHGIVCIASDESWVLGVLSSQIHVQWSLAAGGRLGVGNDPRYTKTACFDPFPFPEATAEQRQKIGALADRLVAHRAEALQASEKVTITKLYNVLEKLRTNAPLTADEHELHRLTACGTLLDLHDALDVAVADAYGWAWPEPPALVLERLVALHGRRVAEEQAGTVRWLRPAYQQPRFGDRAGETPTLDLDTMTATDGVPARPLPWPSDAVGQISVLRTLAGHEPLTVDEALRKFTGGKRDLILRHFETLMILGEVVRDGAGRFRVAEGALMPA